MTVFHKIHPGFKCLVDEIRLDVYELKIVRWGRVYFTARATEPDILAAEAFLRFSPAGRDASPSLLSRVFRFANCDFWKTVFLDPMSCNMLVLFSADETRLVDEICRRTSALPQTEMKRRNLIHKGVFYDFFADLMRRISFASQFSSEALTGCAFCFYADSLRELNLAIQAEKPSFAGKDADVLESIQQGISKALSGRTEFP